MTISGETRLEYSPAVGRRVRLGSWEDQKISTYRKIREALEESRWDDAAELCNYFVDEASVCFAIYRQWIPDLNGFLAENGVPRDEIDAANAEIVAKLDLPDGRALGSVPPVARLPLRRSRSSSHSPTARTRAAALAKLDEPEGDLAPLPRPRRRPHLRADERDRRAASARARSARCGTRCCCRSSPGATRSSTSTSTPGKRALETLMLVACEAMRGHLVGPERTGDFELIETEDRYILRFDPCGSGGRTIRGDWIEGTPAADGAAVQLDGLAGGAHLEPQHERRLPLLHALHPADGGVADGPLRLPGARDRPADLPGHRTATRPSARSASGRCSRTRRRCPEEYYARVGRTRPEAFGSKAMGAPDLPPPMSGMPGAGTSSGDGERMPFTELLDLDRGSAR